MEILKRSEVEEICIEGESEAQQQIDLQLPDFELEKLLIEFNYSKIKQMIENNDENMVEDNAQFYLNRAFLLYSINEEVKAYRVLKKASQIALLKNEYIWYFISQFNIQNLGKIIVQDYNIRCTEEEKSNIQKEIDAIDMQTIFLRTPDMGNENNKFLRDIYTFSLYYNAFQKTYLQSQKIEEQAKKNYIMFAEKPAYEKTRMQIEDMHRYEIYNYIMLDRHSEDLELYQIYGRAILQSACIPEIVNNNLFPFHSGNVRVEALESFDLFIIIKYMSIKDINSIIESSRSKTLVFADGVDTYIDEVAKNIFDTDANKKYLWNFIEIMSYTELSIELANTIMKGICKVIKDVDLNNDNYNVIERFYDSLKDKDFNKDVILDCVKKIIDVSYENMVQNGFYLYEELFKYSICFMDSMGIKYTPQKIEILKKENLELLGKIYICCEGDIQKIIKEIVSDYDWDKKDIDGELYCDLVLNNVISPSKKAEENILEIIDKASEHRRQGYFFDKTEKLINMLAVLSFEKK